MYRDKKPEIWNIKFNDLLVVLQNEYAISIESLRNVDEKANKYLTVLSIIFAATFTALSSDLSDNVKFTLDRVGYMSLTNFLSILFTICLTLGIFFGGETFVALLKSMKLIRTERMPTYEELLNRDEKHDELDFKGIIVQYYQKAIDEIKCATISKQEHIDEAEKKICRCSLILITALIILLFIKYIGN